MQKHKKPSARILSLVLTVAMVTTMLPATVFAAEGDVPLAASSIGTIQSFDKLEDRFIPSTGNNAPDHIYALSVALNTPAEDLNLPAELNTMVARTSTATMEDVKDSGAIEESKEGASIPNEDKTTNSTVPGNEPVASSSEAEKEAIPDESAPLATELEQEESAITTVKQESIPVTWTSDKKYKSDVNGKFIYTAVLPESYTLADGVELPQIYVSVGRQAREASSDVITVIINGTGAGVGGATLQAVVEASGAATDVTSLKITAGEVTENDWSYLKKLTALTSFEVADTIDNGKVANIPDGNTNKFPKSIVTVVVPQAITIGNFAFSQCPALTSVSFPASTKIGTYVFYECTALQSASFSAATNIGRLAFGGCTALTSASFSAVTTIGESVFDKCAALATLKLGATPPNMGNGVFKNCTALSEVSLVNNDGSALTSDEFAVALTLYDSKNDSSGAGYATDGKWYGLTIVSPPTGPTITIGTQTGTINYGTAGTATYAVTGKDFDSTAFSPSVQWKSGANWSATAPTGITGAFSGSGGSRTFTVTTTATVNAGEYEFKVVSGAVESAAAKVKIDKIEYPGKTQSFSVKSDTANASATATLPTIAGATYGTVNVKTNTDSLISGTPTVSVKTLTMNVTSQPDGKTAVLEIPVANATNYKDFTMTVNITAKDKTAATITAAVAGKTYNGVAVTQPTPTAVEKDTTTPVTLTYTYTWQKKGESGGYTDISGNAPPKDVGSYKLVIEGSSDTHAGTKEVEFTIAKSSIAIKANSKTAYVGDAVPVLSATDCTVTGLATGETLKTPPTIAYAGAPDMTKEGTVAINAALAVAPEGGNYEDTITYTDGSLTISTKPNPTITVTIDNLSAPANRKYTGMAIANTEFGTPSYSPSWTGTLEYTYYKNSVSTENKLTEAPKNAGSYILIASIPNGTKYRGKEEIAFSIAKAGISIRANDKTAYVGDAVPVLSSADCTITGLVTGETLKIVPTIAYASTPNMTKAGTVAINATRAVVPDGGNYEDTIAYIDGTLTINAKSGGGGGSSGGGGGSSSGGGGSSSGGGGSSSGGGGSSSKPTEPVSGNSNTNATVDKNGNTTTTVTDKNISDAVKAAQDAASKKGVNAGEVTAVINVTTPANSNPNMVSVNLPKTVQQDIISNKIGNVAIVIDKPDISIGMTLATITEMNKQANADIALSATRTDASKLSTEAKNAIGSRPAFDLKATFENGSKNISNFGAGMVSIAIPYALQEGEVADGLYAVYVDDNGKVNQITNSNYDAKAKALRFATNHFSVYGIAYKTPVGFTDIASHWAKTNIEFVVDRGLMSGTSDTTFAPNSAMTRGMFVTALGRLSAVDVNSYKTTKFSDVKADAYYAPYVNWAAEKGIVKGTSETTFAPDQSISRQEMAVMLSNHASALGYNVPETRDAVTFADNGSIGSWAASAVKQMQMAGILNGKNGNTFDPIETATRGEISAMLHLYVEMVIDRTTTEG